MQDLLPLLVAALAAGAIILIVVGLAGRAPVDPVQARLTQLGTMQAKNLEELELQQPFYERTIRPLITRLSGIVARSTSTSFTQQTEKRLALAGNPGGLRTADWLGIKAVGAIVGGLLFFLLFFLIGVLTLPLPIQLVMIVVGAMFGYTLPEFWLGGRVRARQKAILLQIPDALDLLTISVRAGLGFDGALGKVVEKLRGPLVEEFRRALAEIRVGKARRAPRCRPSPTSSAPSSRPSSWACRSARCSRSSRSSCGSSAASGRRRWRPRRRSRCCSRWSAASSRRCSS
jgi:tight adherence protein C